MAESLIFSCLRLSVSTSFANDSFARHRLISSFSQPCVLSIGRIRLTINLVPGLHTNCARPGFLFTVGQRISNFFPLYCSLKPGVPALSLSFPLSEPLVDPYIQVSSCTQQGEVVYLNLSSCWNWKFLLLWTFSKPCKPGSEI